MTESITHTATIIVSKGCNKMAAINNYDARELKEGIIQIHRMLELRKLHMKNLEAGQICSTCSSICSELGLQKQTLRFLNRH
ncbi:MAG: hypothetical protein N3E52_00340 [Candidatus Bathyarchaeota archaeon]|nr:hypothetical protein [Candidatus Bathyarchaeota archaeon]